jgi:hypothetical protein
MKKIFRFLRGELNGFYIKNISYCLNNVTRDIEELLKYFWRVQFKDPTEVTDKELPISEHDLLGIGRFAGIFMPNITADSTSGSLRFSNAHIIDGINYSERGLFERFKEDWTYFRTNQNTYTDDISTLATRDMQTGFVPEGQPILGYIEEGVDMIDENGYIRTDLILPSPPVGKAYSPYYGEQFMHLAEVFTLIQELGYDTYMTLFTNMQYIMYNGVNVRSFLRITDSLVSDYVENITIEADTNRYIVEYTLNHESEIDNRIKRLFAWQYIIKQTYKLFVLQERVT